MTSSLATCPRCGAIFNPVGRHYTKTFCSRKCAGSVGGSKKKTGHHPSIESPGVRERPEWGWLEKFNHHLNVNFAKWEVKQGLVSKFNARPA